MPILFDTERILKMNQLRHGMLHRQEGAYGDAACANAMSKRRAKGRYPIRPGVVYKVDPVSHPVHILPGWVSVQD